VFPVWVVGFEFCIDGQVAVAAFALGAPTEQGNFPQRSPTASCLLLLLRRL
jgi:hypothetical protein